MISTRMLKNYPIILLLEAIYTLKFKNTIMFQIGAKTYFLLDLKQFE